MSDPLDCLQAVVAASLCAVLDPTTTPERIAAKHRRLVAFALRKRPQATLAELSAMLDLPEWVIERAARANLGLPVRYRPVKAASPTNHPWRKREQR